MVSRELLLSILCRSRLLGRRHMYSVQGDILPPPQVQCESVVAMRALGTAFQVLKGDKVVCRLVYARLDVAQNLVPNFLNGRDTWNWDTLFWGEPWKIVIYAGSPHL